jgi:signal transduction histidine kinase/CheY-like chemotaxis protein
MDKPLSFFNWSLKKVQSTEPDSFARARVRIIYAILLFSILKTFVVIGFGGAAGQWLQVTRAVIACVIYVVLVKVLLYKPVYLKGLTHVMILVGVLVVWTNIFVYAHKINLVTVQFVYMIALSSFFVLGSRYGIFYAVAGILPVVLFLFFHGNAGIYAPGSPQEFVSPGFEIIVILNFISLVVSHYLFFEAINVNIGEKEKLNRKLQSSIAEANELAESKSNFLSTMSHELRTPLNSVVGISELLLEDKPEERQKENLTILQFSALDLLSLINNILDFNKIDSDKLALEQVPVRLAEFMQNICAVLRIKANNKHLQLRLEVDEGLKKMNIVTDPIRLSQVMYNLIGNAIKFTEKGSVTVKLSLVKKTESEAEVLFSIADTGIGIHPDKHEQIFELFTQAESHLTRKHEGTGLGLAIVKKILALFGSRIELESSQGRGSRFFFTIPFVIAAVDASNNAPTAGQKADLSHLRILIAEDNDVNRMILMKQMDKLKVKPVIVENGEDAYEAFVAGDFDLIFLDLHMPVSDGYQAIEQIRALPAPKGDVHIIAFTASVTEQQKIIDAGFDDYLYKPVNMSDLREKLEKIAVRNKV